MTHTATPVRHTRPPFQPTTVRPIRPATSLYRQPGILVTRDTFAVGRQRFDIADLSDLHTMRGPQHPSALRAAAISGFAVVGLGLGLLLAHPAGRPGAGSYLLLLLAALVPVLIASVGGRFRPRSFELWGQYHGVLVQLFVADDERIFGQVTRALRRAREAHAAEEPFRPYVPPAR